MQIDVKFIAPLPGSKKKHYLAEEWTREELWPDKEHVGLPVLLSGGEEGSCFASNTRRPDPMAYSLEFRGNALGLSTPRQHAEISLGGWATGSSAALLPRDVCNRNDNAEGGLVPVSSP